MKSLKIILSGILLFLSFYLFAQEQSITVIQDSRVDSLVQKNIEYNKNNSVKGFRVTIFSASGNNSKNMATAEKDAFIEKYGDVGIYLVFDEPNFKLKVGNFRTRLEARKFLEKIKASYPDAYIIKDNLETKVMLNNIGSEIQEGYNSGFSEPIDH